MTVLKDTQQLLDKLKVASAYLDGPALYETYGAYRGVLCLSQNAYKKNDLATGKTVLGQIKVSSSIGSITGAAYF
jgi:hypothetical protein